LRNAGVVEQHDALLRVVAVREQGAEARGAPGLPRSLDRLAGDRHRPHPAAERIILVRHAHRAQRLERGGRNETLVEHRMTGTQQIGRGAEIAARCSHDRRARIGPFDRRLDGAIGQGRTGGVVDPRRRSGIAQAQRIERDFAHRLLERLAGRGLHDRYDDEPVGHRIIEFAARLEGQVARGEAAHRFGGAEVAGDEVGLGLQRRDEVVGNAAGVRQQMRELDPGAGIGAVARQQRRDRCVERKLAGLDQLEDRHGGEELGDRGDAVHRLGGHRPGFGDVRQAEIARVDRLAGFRAHDRAAETVRFHECVDLRVVRPDLREGRQRCQRGHAGSEAALQQRTSIDHRVPFKSLGCRCRCGGDMNAR
jgi:hypothetical protein